MENEVIDMSNFGCKEELVKIATSSRDYYVYKRRTVGGGNLYIDDSVPTGVIILDTTIADPETLAIALKNEPLFLDELKKNLGL